MPGRWVNLGTFTPLTRPPTGERASCFLLGNFFMTGTVLEVEGLPLN
jgi:hypothetical protein